MLTELPISLRSPVHLPEGKSGKMSLRHSDKKRFDVVSVREGLLTGRLPQLYEEGMGLWIADIPIEISQHKEALVKMAPRGNVLVGGLGLGIAATLLANMPQVDRVDVVEINPDVIKLCDPHHPKVRVIDDDLKAFLGEGLDMPMTLRRAKWFVQNIGTPGWEKRYGKLYPEGESDD